jgi:chromosome segregation ATPase
MNRFSNLFGRRDTANEHLSNNERSRPAPDEKESDKRDPQIDIDRSEPESYSELGARLGEDGEALRNLIAEAGRKISEFDEIKESFVSVVEPAKKALTAFEQERTRNLNLTRALTQTRAGYDDLHAKFVDLEKRAANQETDGERARQELESTRQLLRQYKNEKAELDNELVILKAAKAQLDQQQSEQSARIRILTEENQRFRDALSQAEGRTGELEDQVNALREKLQFLEGDNGSLQKSLDQAVAEVADLSQRLAESDAETDTMRTKLIHLEPRLSEVESERNKLVAQLNDVRERNRAEIKKLQFQIEGVQTRTAMAEKILTNTRQLLAARVEEARVADRRASEATYALQVAEKKVSDLEIRNKIQSDRVKEVEHANAALHERATMLAASLSTRDAQLSEAEQKIESGAERVAQLESEIKVARMTLERRLAEMHAAIENERLERGVTEGALKAAREERAALQRELSKLRASLRHGRALDEVVGKRILRELDQQITATNASDDSADAA